MVIGVALVALHGAAPLAQAQTTGPRYSSAEPQATPAAESPDATQPEPRTQAVGFNVVAGDRESRIAWLIEQMTLEEKIGQLVQVYPSDDQLSDETAQAVREGRIGSLFFPGNAAVVAQAQQIAREESRLGIPLIIARDVIHGFRTVHPIPLGQAATWNPGLVEQAARAAAREAMAEGVDWTFAPMLDVCRDARWGRIAETLGEDPMLAGTLGAAMVRGFQMEQDGQLQGILACAKHFVGYGLAEGGRDYNRVSVSGADLHNVHLPAFRAAVDAGCWTLMTAFHELNGVPCTAHQRLIQSTLKQEWAFRGVVVSDWGSIREMVVHGYAEDLPHASKLAIDAGVDMDMCNEAYGQHLAGLVGKGEVSTARLEDAVKRVLRAKFELAARDASLAHATPQDGPQLARRIARESVVLLKNAGALPLATDGLTRIAVIGPMADSPKQQMGTWSLDGDVDAVVTPLGALRERFAGKAEVVYARGAANTFSADDSAIQEAVQAATGADVVLFFGGEDAVLSGEARSRASLSLPGVQSELLAAIAEAGAPTVLVLMAGRPLAIPDELEAADAVLFAWHPGTMGGPAIVDLLLGDASPSGRLPVTFPRSVGQVPLYYNHTNTGRPSPRGYRPLVGSGADDLPTEHQYKSHYLDESPHPLFPFGFGLTYGEIEYSQIAADRSTLSGGGEIEISATVTNTGDRVAVETAQLYIRDRVASIIRPVRQLKAFRQVRLGPGDSKRVAFRLAAGELGFADNAGEYRVEAGAFDAWIGGNAHATQQVSFEIESPTPEIAAVPPTDATPYKD